MRASALILTVLAGALFATAAPAQQGYRIEFLLGGNDAGAFRIQLETQLAEFVQSLPEGTQRALGPHNFQDAPDDLRTLDDAAAHWGTSGTVLLIIMGQVKSTGTDFLRATGEVYLGFSNAQSLVHHPGDAYRQVVGQVGRSGDRPRFDLYQEMTGYALLLRAWQRRLPREHIEAIAQHIEEIPISQLTATSPCHALIRAAVERARLKAPLQALTPARFAEIHARPLICN